MARIEFPEEVRRRVDALAAAGPTDLVLGIAGAVHPEDLRARIAALPVDAIPGASDGRLKIVVAYQGPEEPDNSPAAGIEFLPYPSPQHDHALGPWVEMSDAQRLVLALASLLQARGCAVLHSDLQSLNPTGLHLLAGAVLEGVADLVMPIYPEGKYDGLINKSLLSPLSRALFGGRIRTPLPFDFCAAGRLFGKLSDPGSQSGPPPSQLLWPSSVAAMNNARIRQARLDAAHTLHTEGLDLSAVLTLLAGALFQEVEAYAAQWQRVRTPQPAEICGTLTTLPVDAQPVDARPLIDSFVLASRNLEEVWRLVLPPVTVFDLQRLTRLPPENFRMPDQLWARVVYDFALAWRLRRIGRAHLLGALTPLYLGWVASYAQEVGEATVAEADARVEKLARAFEESKPYFVSRWRWPDRTS